MDYNSEIGGDVEAGPLPCLNSYISTENTNPTPLKALSTQARRSAYVLTESVQFLAEKYGIEHLGFLTLTFAQHITEPTEAQRRLNSLISHVIKPRYGEYLGCFERQKSGRIHYHLLIVLDQDIRTGVDFAALARRSYTSAGPALRKEWAFWRTTAKKYGFGRTELLPVKTNMQAMAKYVGKYISKHMEAREAQDKGVRLVRYSRGARVGNTRFQFHSPGSMEWRRKVAIFAGIIQSQNPDKTIESISDLAEICGKRWAWHHREYIASIDDQ